MLLMEKFDGPHLLRIIAEHRPPTSEDLKAFARARLSAYKVPKAIEFVDQVPRTDMFKIRRAALISERS